MVLELPTGPSETQNYLKGAHLVTGEAWNTPGIERKGREMAQVFETTFSKGRFGEDSEYSLRRIDVLSHSNFQL